MSQATKETIKILEEVLAERQREINKMKWLINELCALAGKCKPYPEVLNAELTEKKESK